jgi:hypothetical protein
MLARVYSCVISDRVGVVVEMDDEKQIYGDSIKKPNQNKN